MTSIYELVVNDKVDFKLSPIGDFEKGNFMRGTVIGFTLGKYVKIESPTYTKRSGLAMACVPVTQIRPHRKANARRKRDEFDSKFQRWISEHSVKQPNKMAKKAKKEYQKYLELAQK